MFDADVICRAALYPKFVTPTGVFDPESLLALHASPDKTVYSLSVASRFICGDEAGVHNYGSSAARVANDRFVRDNGRQPSPLTEKVHYLGFYELQCGDARNLRMEYYDIRCYWLPENGMDCHFQIDLRQCKTGSKPQRRSDRRAAVGILYDRMSGPSRFICPEDEEYRSELEAVDLPDKERTDA